MRRLLLLCALAGLTACALRPTYRSLVPPETTAAELKLLLVDRTTGSPLPNVKVELSEWKNRYSTTTGADGTFVLPVAKKYLEENPVLVVAVPRGVKGYELRTPPPTGPGPEAAPPTPAAPAPEAPAPEAPAPAGTEPVKM